MVWPLNIVARLLSSNIRSKELVNFVPFTLQPQEMTDALEIMNYIFTAVFGIEMILKLIGLGPYGYIKDVLNIFDGSIVIMR